MHFSDYYSCSKGSKTMTKAQRLGDIMGEGNKCFLYEGMVWGVDPVHLVWVGGGIKKSQGGQNV